MLTFYTVCDMIVKDRHPCRKVSRNEREEKMKKLLRSRAVWICLWMLKLGILAPAVCVAAGFPLSWVENQTQMPNAKSTSTAVEATFSHSFNDQWGSYTWFQMGQGYRQVYAGPTWSPRPWMQVGLALGAENAQDKKALHANTYLRAGGFLWVGRGSSSFVLIGEDGGIGSWWRSEFNFALTGRLGLGFLAQNHKGIGPRVEYWVPGTSLKLWGALPFSSLSLHESTFFAGVRYGLPVR
jgi:hypothetical protein